MNDSSSASEATPVAARRGFGRRDLIVALAFLACIVAYTDRVNISVAAVAMQEQLGWSQTEKGLVLSSFFIGYMLLMFASGWLTLRFGGKRVLGIAVVAWSVFTLLTPWSAMTSFGVLIAMRIAMGLGEAAIFPASYGVFARWVPAGERARAVARLLSGIPIGTVIGLIATGWIVSRYDWPMAFYSFGVLGLVWAFFWFSQVHDDPADDPRVSAAERAILPRDVAPPSGKPKIAWGRLLGSVPVWAVVVSHFASNWILYTLLAWLPSYFREVQHLSIANAGLFSAAPWLSMAVMTNLAAMIADGMIARGVSLTRTRKLMQGIGLVGPALCLLATQNVTSPTTALLLLCGASGALGFCWSGYAPNWLDLSPKHGALLMGFSNTIATIPGIVGVAITGWLVDVTGTYSAAFILSASVAAVGALAYVLFFDAKPLEL